LLAGAIKKLAARLKRLPADNELRIRVTQELLEKLEAMGVINVASSLTKAEAVPASAFARRRLPVVMVRMNMAETVSAASDMVKHGHIRVGPEVITDPAYLVTRAMEDFVTWVDTSKIKRTVMRYNDKLDDFDLLGV
jgi:U3 small nucleolar ribonucleoprotein protein IMP3